MRESELQSWLNRVIGAGELYTRINGKDQLQNDILEDGAALIGSFPIDYLLRKKALAAAKHVMAALTSVELVSTADVSISLDRDETLFPDCVLCNPESAQIVLLELKRERNASRQALTELLAYEHEVRNALPFLSHADLCLVVVSTEYPPLLEHSVAALLTWTTKQVLCLQVDVTDEEPTLSIHIPKSWSYLGQDGLPAQSMTVATLSLYPGSKVTPDPNHLARAIDTAAELIAREGDRLNSHGFVLVWEDTWAKRRPEALPWSMTIGFINPYQFAPSAQQIGLVDAKKNPLGRFLLEQERFQELSDAYGDFENVCSRAMSLLEEYCNPQWEGFACWEDVRAPLGIVYEGNEVLYSLRHRARPTRVDFWGAIGDFARDLVVNPAVRTSLLPSLSRHALDWHHPYVGLLLLDDLTGIRLIDSRGPTCSALYWLGVGIGVTGTLCASAEALPGPDYGNLDASLAWNAIDLIPALYDLQQWYLAAEDLNVAPPPTLTLRPAANSQETRQEVEALAGWISGEFLRTHPIHQVCFELGLASHATTDPYLAIGFVGAHRTEMEQRMVQLSRMLLGTVTEAVRSSSRDMKDEDERRILHDHYFDRSVVELPSEDIALLLEDVAATKHLEGIPNVLMRLLDRYIPPMFSVVNSPEPRGVDWAYFRESVAQMRRAGTKYPAVVWRPDGTLGLAVLSGEAQPLPMVIDTEKQVLLLQDLSGGIEVVLAVAWEDLISGELWRKLRSVPNPERADV